MLEWIPNIDIDRPIRILCLGAHPDDIEIGCGGSLLHLSHAGRALDVRWEVFSGSRTRADEARKSADCWLAGIDRKKIVLHDFKDGFFPDDWAAIKNATEQIKADFEPDLVFTHRGDDLHQDHRTISELTWNTFRSHFILEYEIPKYDGDLQTPNFYIPLALETAKAKSEALLRFFASQKEKHWFCEELFLGLMRIRGMEASARSGYAEGFCSRKVCWKA